MARDLKAAARLGAATTAGARMVCRRRRRWRKYHRDFERKASRASLLQRGLAYELVQQD